jgi:aminopeptidase N
VLSDATARKRRRAYAGDTPSMILSAGERGTVDADTLTWRYRAEKVRDVAFTATKGVNWEGARAAVGDRDGDGDVDSTRINTFWRDSAPKWAEVTTYQQHAITHLSDYLNHPYPWPHMTAVEGGGIIGGGMEFPMMTIMGDYNNNSARMLYAVTAHELAHMWVPMIVSTNERRYSWMDEGTTSFNENLARKDYFEDSQSIETDRRGYLRFARSGQELPIMRWSNYYPAFGQFGVAAYRKPATLHAALRGLLGAETYDAALQDFVDTWAYKHPYPSDFFNTVERVSGRELDWFWYSWYYTTWTLDQSIAAVTATGDRTDVRVEDLGKVPMPVRLTVTLTDGETLEREIPVDVWLRGRTSATTTLNVNKSEIETIQIDAAHHFPDVNRSNNTWTAPEQASR